MIFYGFNIFMGFLIEKIFYFFLSFIYYNLKISSIRILEGYGSYVFCLWGSTFLWVLYIYGFYIFMSLLIFFIFVGYINIIMRHFLKNLEYVSGILFFYFLIGIYIYFMGLFFLWVFWWFFWIFVSFFFNFIL